MRAIKKRFRHNFFRFLLASLFTISCNKLVQVPNPISSVTANQVFSSDAAASAAMLGIYSYMSGHSSSFSNVCTTEFPGESADELTDEPSGDEKYDRFVSDALNPVLNSSQILSDFWQPAYFDIYSANAVILGLQSSTGVSTTTK